MALLDLQGMESKDELSNDKGKDSNLSVTLCDGTSRLSVLLCE
ncbi:SapB/AmfS family lanthipeptide [Glycomyces xiaoerkulensis]|nr:SapB/AmfS family lanthipeptide [Glycomyces xiaoerkulensis]